MCIGMPGTRCFLFLLIFWIEIINLSVCASEKVLLNDVRALTLYKGKLTTGRRSSPVPQIRCVGGEAQGKVEPRVVQCYNRGFDGSDVQWECKAEMNDQYEFGQISVSCEGYDYANDPYILKGSCGLEYELEYTTSGNKAHKTSSKVSKDKEESSLFSKIGTGILILFFIYIAYTTWFNPTPGSEGDVNRRGYGGGFDGGPGYPGSGGFGGPPPSYDDTMGFKGSNSHGFGSMGSGPVGGGGPGGLGFWSGLGLGGLGGYILGQRQTGDGVRQRFSSSQSQFARDTGFYESHADEPSTSNERETSGFGGTTRR